MNVFISPLKIKTSTPKLKSEAYVGVWTEESVAVSFLTSRDIPFDKVVKWTLIVLLLMN